MGVLSMIEAVAAKTTEILAPLVVSRAQRVAVVPWGKWLGVRVTGSWDNSLRVTMDSLQRIRHQGAICAVHGDRHTQCLQGPV